MKFSANIEENNSGLVGHYLPGLMGGDPICQSPGIRLQQDPQNNPYNPYKSQVHPNIKDPILRSPQTLESEGTNNLMPSSPDAVVIDQM